MSVLYIVSYKYFNLSFRGIKDTANIFINIANGYFLMDKGRSLNKFRRVKWKLQMLKYKKTLSLNAKHLNSD